MSGNNINKPMQYLHQPPINPFRTKPRADEIQSVLLTNPWLKSCYVGAVVTLTIAVLVVAFTAFSQILNPLETSSSIIGPHRLTSFGLKSSSNKSVRLGSGGVQSLRLPPLQRPNSLLEGGVGVPPKELPNTEYIRSTSQSPKIYTKSLDDERREYQSVYPQEEDGENMDEDLMRPGDAQLRIIGEAKEKVKQEMDRETYSEHAFGVQQEVHGDNASDLVSTAEQGDQALLSAQVHVVHRKGEAGNLRATINLVKNIDHREVDANTTNLPVLEAINVSIQDADNERIASPGESRSQAHSEIPPNVAVPIVSG